jgi:hypothetical protein
MTIAVERRRYYRASLSETWVYCTNEVAGGRYLLCDFSQGGGLLLGDPVPPIETAVRLGIRLPGCEMVSLDAQVVAHRFMGDAAIGFSVQFDYLNDEEQDTIGDYIAHDVTCKLSPMVLVAGSRRCEVNALVRTVRDAGFYPVPVRRPLDAICCLERGYPAIGAIVLSLNFGRVQALEVAAFIGDYYPGIRRILVASPSWKTRLAADGLVDTVVRKPWTVEGLENALVSPHVSLF